MIGDLISKNMITGFSDLFHSEHELIVHAYCYPYGIQYGPSNSLIKLISTWVSGRCHPEVDPIVGVPVLYTKLCDLVINRFNLASEVLNISSIR